MHFIIETGLKYILNFCLRFFYCWVCSATWMWWLWKNGLQTIQTKRMMHQVWFQQWSACSSSRVKLLDVRSLLAKKLFQMFYYVSLALLTFDFSNIFCLYTVDVVGETLYYLATSKKVKSRSEPYRTNRSSSLRGKKNLNYFDFSR